VFYSVDGLHVEEDETNMFGVNGASMEKPSQALVNGEISLYFHLSVQIHLVGGRPMKVNFKMLTSLLNKFLGFQGLKLKLKECLA
jgi:hypothetical protein